MATEFFIRVGLETKRLDAAKVLTCVRTRGNMVVDTLALETTEPLALAGQWSEGAIGYLFMRVDGEDTPLFTGRFVDPEGWARWDGRGHRYLLAGPWERFALTPFSQMWTIFVTVNSESTHQVPLSRVLLWNGKDSARQIEEVVDYLLVDQARDGSLLPFAKGTIDAALELRPAKAGTVMCSEVVMQSLRLLPRAVCWFDYSSIEFPVFYCRNYENLTQVTMPLAASVTAPGTKAFQARERSNLRVRYVRLAWKTQERPEPTEEQAEAGEIPDFKALVPGVAIAPAGYSGAAYGGLDHTFDELETWQAEQGQNMANFLYAQNAVAPWEGQHALKMTPLTLSLLRPGLRYNVSGTNAVYETMNALVQQVVDDLLAKTTTVQFGPPKQLGPQDLVERLHSLKQMLTPSTQGETQEQGVGSWSASTGGHERTDISDPNSGPRLPAIPGGGELWLRANGGALVWVEGEDSCP